MPLSTALGGVTPAHVWSLLLLLLAGVVYLLVYPAYVVVFTAGCVLFITHTAGSAVFITALVFTNVFTYILSAAM